MANRSVVVAKVGHGGNPGRGGPCQCITQCCAGIDKRGSWQVHAQHLRHQLIGVGSTVEGAGAGTVVGLDLGDQHLLAIYFSFGKELTDVCLFPVGQAGGHGACRNQDHGQVAELKTAHEQPGHDLVADPEQQRTVKDVMGQADNRGHGNHVPADQAQVHAWLPLGNPITHGRHAAGKLGRAPGLADRLLDDLRVGLVGLVGRDYIIIR